MKFVIAVCHGQEDARSLSPIGVRQAEMLAEAIEEKVRGAGRIVLFTSEVDRAIWTGEIIGRRLGIESKVLEALGSKEYRNGFYQRKEILEAAGDCDVAIVITHLHAPSGIANAFRMESFQRGVGSQPSNNGCGFFLSLETGEVTCLP